MVELPKTLFTYVLGLLAGVLLASVIWAAATVDGEIGPLSIIAVLIVFVCLLISWLWGES